MPLPATIRTSALSIFSSLGFFITSKILILLPKSILFVLQFTISPFISSLYAGVSITLYLTVAICGRLFGVSISAMIFPPNAGLICTRSVVDFISNIVQSAVNPVLKRAATFGANCLPTGVAPTKMLVGLLFFIKSSNTLVYFSILKHANSSSS